MSLEFQISLTIILEANVWILTSILNHGDSENECFMNSHDLWINLFSLSLAMQRQAESISISKIVSKRCEYCEVYRSIMLNLHGDSS